MTFLAPAQIAHARASSILFGRRAPRPQGRLRIADEDGARRALGGEGSATAAASSGSTIEHLARIALG